MKVCQTIAEVRAALRQWRTERGTQRPATVGFVPTMGYLHDGHASLLAQAREQCEITVLSIFLNPLQFAPGEDLAVYPRDVERDLKVARDMNTDLVFMPDVQEMYPNGSTSLTTVRVQQVTKRMCGAVRPGHFDGVATVVSKLFHIVQPDRAYFGLKDAQQVAVIEQMVADLNVPVDIVACPTIREADGLALSSRNVYLSPDQRAAAPVIYRSLQAADEWLADESLTFPELTAQVRHAILQEPQAVIDYIECVQYPSFADLPEHVRCSDWLADGQRRVLLAAAVKFGTTRLIDNRLLGGGHRV